MGCGGCGGVWWGGVGWGVVWCGVVGWGGVGCVVWWGVGGGGVVWCGVVCVGGCCAFEEKNALILFFLISSLITEICIYANVSIFYICQALLLKYGDHNII